MHGTDDLNEMQMLGCIAGLIYLYPTWYIILACFAYLKRIRKTGYIVETTPKIGELLNCLKGISKTGGDAGIGPKTVVRTYQSLTVGTSTPGNTMVLFALDWH